jgi:phosphate transport system substrate-binding protein
MSQFPSLFGLARRRFVAAAGALAIGVAALGAAPLSSARAADITGAGATFPYPVYAKWAEAYKAKTGTGMNYQSIGSGGGIKQITAKTVDFGASDMPLPPADLDKNGLAQFPTVMGGVVPVYNLPGIEAGKIKLDGETLANIYLGTITKWDDAAIAKLNPDVKLPSTAITVVYRSDGSGTTFIYSNYLSKVSAVWKDKIGEGTSIEWKTGIGGKGNEGVAGYVKNTVGAIGYVEYAYALQNKLSYVQLKNKDGKFVAPKSSAFQAAAANADWAKAPGFALLLTDQAGAESWPITGATFILMQKKQANADKAMDVLKFFDWAYANGDKMAAELEYVPLPDSVKSLVHKQWAEVKDTAGKPVAVK